MKFKKIITPDSEEFWINPYNISAIMLNEDGEIEIYIADDMFVTNMFENITDAFKHLGINQEE